MKLLKKNEFTKRLGKNKPIVIGGLIVLLVLLASLFFVDWEANKYQEMSVREGDGYRVLVPTAWNEAEGESQTTYFAGNNIDKSNDAIIVGHSSQPVPGYEDYNQQEKEELLVVLESLMNSYINSETGESAASYEELSTEVGEHPQSELALDMSLSGSNQKGEMFKGEGRLLVTENGYFYFILVGSEADTFSSENASINSVIDSFELIRV